MVTLVLLAHIGAHPACWCGHPRKPWFYNRYSYNWYNRTPAHPNCWRGFTWKCCCLPEEVSV